jgi:hypothetical protein
LRGFGIGIRFQTNFYFQDFGTGDIQHIGTDNRFGQTLTAGSFNGDSFSDLAIGAPFALNGAGQIGVVYGTNTGLQSLPSNGLTPRAQFINQGTFFGGSGLAAGDHFGATLAAGDFNNDNRDDLAVGVPDENVGKVVDAGVVVVIYGSGAATGLSAIVRNAQIWHQGRSDGNGTIDNQLHPGDRFAAALAAADFNLDGFDDLAVGVPNEERRDRIALFFTDHIDAGMVHVIYGKGTTSTHTAGLTAELNQALFQGGHSATAQPRFQGPNFQFGSSLTAWNFGKGRTPNPDLVVGVPGDDLRAVGTLPGLPPINNAGSLGAVQVLYSRDATGFQQSFDLSSPLNEKWSLDSELCTLGGWHCIAGITAQKYDRFGDAVY